MKTVQIPQLSEQEINDYLLLASGSIRQRHPKILHNPGDEFNRVINFIMQDSYMQPHLHSGVEKIEKIYLIRGKIAVFFFDDQGAVKNGVVMKEGGVGNVEVPAFTWHTYVMLSDYAITYETMMGVYDPKTWKEFAQWAPPENSSQAPTYLNYLKEEAAKSVTGP